MLETKKNGNPPLKKNKGNQQGFARHIVATAKKRQTTPLSVIIVIR